MNTTLFPDLIVNGETVPHAVVAAETQNQDAPKGKPGIAWRKAANAVAIRTLLLQEARSLDLAATPQEAGPGRFEIQEEAMIRALLEQAVDVLPPSDAEIKAEWEKDPERFRTPPLWEASHILCACDPHDEQARAKALTRAMALANMIARDPRAFPALASRESDCGSKSAGGALGQLGPGDTVTEFEAVLRKLAEGETTVNPVRTRHGYHIIRLNALAREQVLPFESVHAKIAEAMEKAAWANQARQYVQRLVKAANIQGADLRMM